MKVLQMKKICFIVSSPITAIAFLSAHMEKLSLEFEVHLVANFISEEEKKQFENINCHSVPIQRKINIINDWRAMWKLKHLFVQEKFYAVHSVTPKAGLLTAIAGFIAHIPNRIHIFTGQVWATRRYLMRWGLMALDKLITVLDTKLLVDGESQRQFLIKHHILKKDNSLVVGEGSICGVQTDRFMPDVDKRRNIREELNILDDKIVFIFLGRLNRDKGIDELFSAFDRLVKKYNDAYLLLVGMDEEKYNDRIVNFSNIEPGKNYQFYGQTNKPEDLLRAADVFCLPSYREGFGTSVIEASSVGLPVICSDTYGIMDAMEDSQTGLRCKVGDIDSLYVCMEQLLNSKELCYKLGRNGRKRVLDKFSSKAVVQAWSEFYRNL